MSDAPDESNRSTPLPSASPDPVPPPLVFAPAAPTTSLDGALPFQRTKTHPTPHAEAAPAFAPSRGIVFPRCPAPRELANPGVLMPLGAFLSSLGAPAAVRASTTSAIPVPMPAIPEAPTTAPGTLGESGDSPWLVHGGPALPFASTRAEATPASESTPRSVTESPEALGSSSPWLASPSVPPPGVLPSTAGMYLSPGDAPSAARPQASIQPPAPSPSTAESARPAMTLVLVLAALGLIGAIAYVTLSSGKKSEDPADVKAGQSQREYVLQAQTATASASASAAPPPPPRLQVRPMPPPPAASAAPPKPTQDLYEDL
jgi:hypothetical protein